MHTAEDVGDKLEDDADSTKADPCRATLVVSDLGDRLEWEDWWRARIGECFPTLAEWKRLNVLSFNSCEFVFGWLSRLFWNDSHMEHVDS